MSSAAPPKKTPLILTVSRDPLLLASRNALLREAGYDVVSSLRDEEAVRISREHKVDAVVLGDSIAPEERTKLVQTLRALDSKLPIIVLKLATESVPTGATACMGSLDGPAVLLGLIADALRNASAHAA